MRHRGPGGRRCGHQARQDGPRLDHAREQRGRRGPARLADRGVGESRRCRRAGHTDAARPMGKIDADGKLNVDYLTLVAKFGARRGGALPPRRCALPSMLYGGGQENGRRAGTEAVRTSSRWAPRRTSGWRRGRRSPPTRRSSATHCAALEKRLGAGVGAPSTVPWRRGYRECAPERLVVRGARLRRVERALKGQGRGRGVGVGRVPLRHGGGLGRAKAVGVEQELAVGTLRLSVGRHTTDAEVRRAADVLVRAILHLAIVTWPISESAK